MTRPTMRKSATSRARVRPASLALIAAATTLVTLLLMQISPGDPRPGSARYQSPEWAVMVHLSTVLPAVVLGAWLLWRRKGGSLHRRLGSIWIGCMATTAIVSFWVRGPSGGLSGIHLLSAATLVALPMAVWRIRVKDVRSHQQILVSLYIGLLVAGGFALERDRLVGGLLLG